MADKVVSCGLKDVTPHVPEHVAGLHFTHGKVEVDGKCTPTQLKCPPKVDFKADPSKFYTLLKTDPDAPSREDPKWGEWHHWLVVNIPGNEVEKGDTVYQYVGAGPPQDTGFHRYFYLVFEQPGKINYDGPRLTNTSADGRGCQKTSDLFKKLGLVKLVAASVYNAQYDEYVPELYKQLGAA